MRIYSIAIKNYRPFKELKETRIGSMATIVGKNDAGKSSILHGLDLFFASKPTLSQEDFHDSAEAGENLIIQVSFCQLPSTIQIETEIETTLKDEMLLDNGNLTISKTFSREGKIEELALIVDDFKDDAYAELATLKEAELNKRCKDKQIDFTKSGRGITNKDKRKALREKAIASGIALQKRIVVLSTKDDLWKNLEAKLPAFYLYESERDIDVGGTPFQKEFRPIINAAVNNPDISTSKTAFTTAIERALQEEIDQICLKLKDHTDAVTCLTAKAIFSWDKAVVLQLNGKDKHGIDKPLEKRGTGIRRLLMVSFFEHLAQKKQKNDVIFGIEEPENGLHPGLQRDLVQSFTRIVNRGCQVIVTTHSPVFAGSSPIEDLVLIVRENAIAKAFQKPDLDLDKVAGELGVEPSDQIMGYSACVFVEGEDDAFFLQVLMQKFKEAKIFPVDLADKKIGLILYGGDNLKHWINMGSMKKLSKKFLVLKDSDRKKAQDKIPERIEKWRAKCEAEGGSFFCLRKREIENYVHEAAIQASGKTLVAYDDYSDMKQLFGPNIIKVFKEMSAQQILEKDCYLDEYSKQHHELKEIGEKILSLVS